MPSNKTYQIVYTQPVLQNLSGISLVELVAGIGIMFVIILVLGSASTLIAFDRATKYASWATAIAKEELEIVTSQPFASLTNRTNASFAWVPYNYGAWAVAAKGGTPTSPNAYELLGGTPLSNTISGLALAPSSQLTSMTFQASVNVASDSSSGWKAGIVFGMKDHANYYRLTFSTGSLVLEQITNGTASTLYTLIQTFNTNTWYTLKVVTDATTIQVWLDGLQKTTYTGTIQGGELGLLGLSRAHAFFDTVSLTTSSTTTWNFDSDSVGAQPDPWGRFGLYDFAGATGALTIADDGGVADLKRITVTVSWLELRGTRTVTLMTMKSKY